MRWKSEVKVECRIGKEKENGSLVSNDEVSEGRACSLYTRDQQVESVSEILYYSKLLCQLNESGLRSVIKAGLHTLRLSIFTI